jgi:hypothetical protein
MPRLAAFKLLSGYWPSNPNSAIALPVPDLGQQCMACWWIEDEINMMEGGFGI